MKALITALVLVSLLAHGKDIASQQITNEYMSITIPLKWTLEVVGGKDGEMQMSLRPLDYGQPSVSVFAYWNGLDPRKWVGSNVVSQYTLDKHEYFVKRENGKKNLQIIVSGKKYTISTTLHMKMDEEMFALLLNSLNTVKPK